MTYLFLGTGLTCIQVLIDSKIVQQPTMIDKPFNFYPSWQIPQGPHYIVGKTAEDKIALSHKFYNACVVN
jgi:hypothetical protein